MRHALALFTLAALGALACDSGPSTCTKDTDFDCKTVCARLEQFCKEGCGGVEPGNCSDAGCVEACELYRKDPRDIPGSRPELVLGNFNCADDNDSCPDFAGCVGTCFTLNPD